MKIFFGRIQRLEKELYYYKKTSRELKKRLRDLEASGALPHQGIYTSYHYLNHWISSFNNIFIQVILCISQF